MQRREFLLKAAGAAGAAVTFGLARADEINYDAQSRVAREHLGKIMPSREQVKNFILCKQPPKNLSLNAGWLFDAELGWVLCDAVRNNGIEGSKAFYNYEPDGARKVINCRNKTSRIHTYGNSFTHCDQVSNGETWEEYLAAHLQEPIRNYGVGGYSVYQAYRRMLKVEKQNGAEYIILNIWDDDHFRNLDAWRSIRFGHRTACGYTLPHLKVDVQKDQCRQIDNIFTKPEEVYQLCDEDFVWRRFKDDLALQVFLVRRAGKEISQESVNAIAARFGVPDEKIPDTNTSRQIQKIYIEAALYSTKNIITWIEEFVKKTGKKLMVILSFNSGNIAAELVGKARFDQSFVDWLKNKPYPVIDMRDAFRADYSQSKMDINTYLKRYYIGHHNPAGNFFTAWAIKEQLVKWLEPSALPYR